MRVDYTYSHIQADLYSIGTMKCTNHWINNITRQSLTDRRCRRIPLATAGLPEDRLENSSDQLQPLIDRNILKTQQNRWVAAQRTGSIVSIMQINIL